MDALQYREALLRFLSREGYKPMSLTPLYTAFCEAEGLAPTDLPAGEFGALVRHMERDAEVAYSKKDRILTADAAGYIRGRFRSNPRGFGFVIPEERYRSACGGDLFIPPDRTLGAISGDTVVVQMTSGRRADGRGGEGRVLHVAERAHTQVIGTLQIEHSTSRRRRPIVYVLPDDRHLDIAVRIDDPLPGGLTIGSKVEVEITAYPHTQVARSQSGRAVGYFRPGLLHVRGKLLRSFGDAQSPEANYQAILSENGIPTSFPDEVTVEADRVSHREITPEGRLDLREQVILTIDGADARDLDDAISLARLDDGWLLGVHIADVSHYVKEGSRLDHEAIERGTSVYFPDRVVPMLPTALSNGCCSLNAGVDRYALSAQIQLSRDGKILSCTPAETIIRSRVRGVYSEVNDLFEKGKKSIFYPKYQVLGDMLSDMEELYRVLERKSRAAGALTLETAEAMIRVEDGVPIEIVRRERGTAEKLIEQFMLCANEGMAQWLFWQDMPCVYRIHDDPNPEKLQAFSVFAHNLGLDISPLRAKKIYPGALARVLEEAAEKDLLETVSIVMLRALAKAKYSANPSAHFGLAMEKYCHFTSPIRRYPDLAVHRIVKTVLHGHAAEKVDSLSNFAHMAADRSSENEIRAITAERAIDDLFKVMYLQGHIGESFDGVVSSVGPFGFFVTLENSCEGLVPMITLGEGFSYDEPTMTVSRGRSVYTPGTRVRVTVALCDIVSRRVNFTLEEGNSEL